MRVAYADPPYPGCAHRYKNQPDYRGEVDHAELIQQLYREYDGWLLHTSSTALKQVMKLVDLFPGTGAVTRAWAKWKSDALLRDGR